MASLRIRSSRRRSRLGLAMALPRTVTRTEGVNAPASLRCILPHGPTLQGQRLHPNRTSGSPAIEFVFAKVRLEVHVGIADKPLTGHCARRCVETWLAGISALGKQRLRARGHVFNGKEKE